ncbi:RNA-directed DNA polymerase (reverse transcriptase)-related family protein [Rhynchospora pubera]|uniref:RNA-directed DNA polymerase (Reverse transcriptase)-related family protein n=1 Tax=Rhynchospora pubera TaxID=906938 RepID=A0AAV8D089_9POAL|nr:RNA-directed DNA polymerase (reverse transcriptase)-related family protein [Rhynchospora pubera]
MESRPLTSLEKLLKAMLKRRFTEIAIAEEEIWKQRSSFKWGLEGDQNTAFFHAKASSNKRRNFIQTLNVDGITVTDKKSKGLAFFNFFCTLMGSTSTAVSDFEVDCLYSQLQSSDLSSLDAPISQLEVCEVISSWPSNKSPGPEITSTLNTALHSNSLHPLNSSIIALIPKSQSPLTTADFRPISIIHSIQRIFSKILTNRLTPLLSSLITSNQTGFMKGRAIIENITYAQEIIHHCSKTKTPLAIFKADINKAFDTISWSFLSKILAALGFSQSYISTVLGCVLQGASRVVLNGVAGKPILLRRGVRQGDPLSPYLFILAFDFLSRWVTKLNRLGAIPVPLQNIFSSVFYADDALFFFKPTLQQATFLKIVLNVFGSFSGLTINPGKSDLLTLNCSSLASHSLADVLGCRASSFPLIYLGLPLSDKPLVRADYHSLLNKFSTKLRGWSASLLSITGRVVLINSCLSSLPTYFMSVFKLPTWVIKRIDSVRRSFLWHGVYTDKRKLVLISWNCVIKPKKVGGLGILNLSAFNEALLVKWLWKWSSTSYSLWKPLALALQSAPLSSYPLNSKLANILKNLTHLFNVGLIFLPSDGKNILFWQHNWASQILQFSFPDLYSFALDKFISLHFFCSNLQDVYSLFSPLLSTSLVAVHQLSSLLLTVAPTISNLSHAGLDEVFWKLDKSGVFSTSSIYNLITSHPCHVSPLRKIWKMRIPPRFKVFLWMMLQNKIATLDNLQRRGWHLPNRCILCGTSSESVLHLFSSCRFYKLLKDLLLSSADVLSISAGTPPGFPDTPLAILLGFDVPDTIRDLIAITFFVTWRERCSRTFRDVVKQPSDLFLEVLLEWKFFS